LLAIGISTAYILISHHPDLFASRSLIAREWHPFSGAIRHLQAFPLVQINAREQLHEDTGMQMLSLKEVAARLGVCLRTAETMLAEGRLPKPVRFGRLRRWSEDQLDAFIVAEVARVNGNEAPAVPRPRGPGRPRAE
jgi:excisionase family DNA binding protein